MAGTDLHRNIRLLLLCWILINSLKSGVAGEPELNLTVLSEYAVLGQPVQLQCVLKMGDTYGLLIFKLGIFSKCTVRRDNCLQYTGDTSQYTCGCTARSGNEVTYILNITKLANDTDGPWVCEFQKKSNNITLQLSDPQGPTAQSLDAPSPYAIHEHQSINLTCSAECIPDCQFSWAWDDADMSNMTRGERGQILVMDGVTEDQGGHYSCIATNPASNLTRQVSLHLVVQTAPRRAAESTFSQIVYTSIGSSASLSVRFLANPAPTFTWMRVSGGTLTPVPVTGEEDQTRRQAVEPRSDGDHNVTTVLQVLDVDVENLGMYCVIAENEVDTASVYVELTNEETSGKVPNCISKAGSGYISFVAGIGIGAGGMFLVVLLVVAVACRKYRNMKRELEHPYAKTDYHRRQEKDRDLPTAENHYQELPTPTLDRKQITKEPSETPVKSSIYPVIVKDSGIRADDSRSSVEIGKCILNPMYRGFNAYEVPVVTQGSGL